MEIFSAGRNFPSSWNNNIGAAPGCICRNQGFPRICWASCSSVFPALQRDGVSALMCETLQTHSCRHFKVITVISTYQSKRDVPVSCSLSKGERCSCYCLSHSAERQHIQTVNKVVLSEVSWFLFHCVCWISFPESLVVSCSRTLLPGSTTVKLMPGQCELWLI